MSNYKQTDIAGTSWVRCHRITITNPLPGAGDIDPSAGGERGPTAHFHEEKVIALDGVDLRTDIGTCLKVFKPVDTIQVLDPETGEPTGSTVTHGELYAILFSLYMQTAVERDAIV